MPRAIWSGAISFGLVNIPVRLVTAVDRKTVRFREVRRGDHSRIRHRKVAAADGEEVATDDVVKGFEIAPDRYVVLEPDELRALDPEKSRTIDIEDFVHLADIEPLFYDGSYYLVPTETAGKPYELLRRAMEQTGMAGVARFTLRTKQYLAVLRPVDDAIAISTVLYHDEVIDPAALDGLPGEGLEVDERELAMATSLIESMTTEWEPEKYDDQHRQRVLELIERKAEGEEIVTVPEEEREAGDVVDLMAALEASLAAAGSGGASGSSKGGGRRRGRAASASEADDAETA